MKVLISVAIISSKIIIPHKFINFLTVLKTSYILWKCHRKYHNSLSISWMIITSLTLFEPCFHIFFYTVIASSLHESMTSLKKVTKHQVYLLIECVVKCFYSTFVLKIYFYFWFCQGTTERKAKVTMLYLLNERKNPGRVER